MTSDGEWVETTLDEAATIIGGGTPSTKEPEFWGGDIVWLTPTEVVKADGQVIADSARKITAAGLARSSANRLPAGTVLLTTRASVGFVAIAGREVTTNQGFQSLVPKDGVLSEFLMMWVQANRDQFSSRAGGSTFPEISKTNVKTIPIIVPPLAVQRRIVDLVSAVDTHIASLNEEREAARQAWQSAINAQYDGSWAMRPLGEVVAEGSGRLVDGDWIESKDQSPEGTRLLQLADIGRGTFLDKSSRFVSDETFRRLRCTAISDGDLLISRMADPIGRTAALPANLSGSIAAVDVAILSTGGLIDRDYAVGILNADPWIEACDSLGTGTTRKRISRRNLATVSIPVPDAKTQQELGVLFRALNELRESLAKESAALLSVRSQLLQALLSREVEIPGSYDALLAGVA